MGRERVETARASREAAEKAISERAAAFRFGAVYHYFVLNDRTRCRRREARTARDDRVQQSDVGTTASDGYDASSAMWR